MPGVRAGWQVAAAAASWSWQGIWTSCLVLHSLSLVAVPPRHHCLPRGFVAELAVGGLLIQALPNGSAKELSATVW